MGFFGFMRAGQFTVNSDQDVEQATCLSTQDMAVDSHTNPSMVRVHLKQSNQYTPGMVYTASHRCCAKPSGSHLGLLCHTPSHSPFIIFKEGSPLTRDRLVAAVQSALSYPGVDYLGHNFRAVPFTGSASLSLRCWVIGI